MLRVVDLRRSPDADIVRPDPGAPVAGVREIIERVRDEGDAALIDLTEKFDGVRLTAAQIRVTGDEIKQAADSVSPQLISALEEAAARLAEFCKRQLIQPWTGRVADGTLGETVHPVERAGLYAPGGRAIYPSVVVMSAVPASVAGVGHKILCAPPGKDMSIAAPTLAAAHLTGIDEVYRVGGAQAIAAMAYGTETIPKVDVIAGGGGSWVALAKREVAGSVAIDSVAGPSEIAIIADGSADPNVVAADLIAQAEHGPGGVFVLITWDDDLVSEVERALKRRLDEAGASPALISALEEGAAAAIVADRDHAIDALARLAPEHAELICDGAEEVAQQVRNAGAIFVGPYSPVSLGDYLAGSNHTLPTMGSARWASGLRASLFQRTSAVIQYDRAALAGSLPHIQALADAEGLPNHARAVEARLGKGEVK